MEGSSSNAAPRRGPANQALLSTKLGDRRVSSCLTLTAQPHDAAPPNGAHEGVPRGGAADGGGVACVTAGVEGAAGNAEAPGAKRPRGANDSDSSTRDGLDVEQSVGADNAGFDAWLEAHIPEVCEVSSDAAAREVGTEERATPESLELATWQAMDTIVAAQAAGMTRDAYDVMVQEYQQRNKQMIALMTLEIESNEAELLDPQMVQNEALAATKEDSYWWSTDSKEFPISMPFTREEEKHFRELFMRYGESAKASFTQLRMDLPRARFAEILNAIDAAGGNLVNARCVLLDLMMSRLSDTRTGNRGDVQMPSLLAAPGGVPLSMASAARAAGVEAAAASITSNDEGGKWELKKIFDVKELGKDKPQICSADTCNLQACSKWVSLQDTEHQWSPGLDCLDEACGWPEEDGLFVEYLTEDTYMAMFEKCSNQARPAMPDVSIVMSLHRVDGLHLASTEGWVVDVEYGGFENPFRGKILRAGRDEQGAQRVTIAWDNGDASSVFSHPDETKGIWLLFDDGKLLVEESDEESPEPTSDKDSKPAAKARSNSGQSEKTARQRTKKMPAYDEVGQELIRWMRKELLSAPQLLEATDEVMSDGLLNAFEDVLHFGLQTLDAFREDNISEEDLIVAAEQFRTGLGDVICATKDGKYAKVCNTTAVLYAWKRWQGDRVGELSNRGRPGSAGRGRQA